jgi:hypothetical protein
MALVPNDAIKIAGLKELQGALKRIDGESQKMLRVVFNDAVEIVAADARRGVPTRSGKARASVKAQSGQREARVIGGSKKVPYYPWLDFGGTVGKGRTGRGGVASAAGRSDAGTAGMVKRKFIADGRYLYPAYRRNRDEVFQAMIDGLKQLLARVGWTTTDG